MTVDPVAIRFTFMPFEPSSRHNPRVNESNADLDMGLTLGKSKTVLPLLVITDGQLAS